jgi:hypothetical protein
MRYFGAADPGDPPRQTPLDVFTRAAAITEQFVMGADSPLEPLTAGSTRPIAETKTRRHLQGEAVHL